MYKVLIADKLSEEAVKIFKDNDIETVVKTGLSESDWSHEMLYKRPAQSLQTL